MLIDRFRLDDRVAIVTAAGRGIGAASALAFAESGADVVIAARTVSQLEEVAAQVRKLGRNAVVVATDLSDVDAVEGLVETAVREFGRLDIVVNNVGGSGARDFASTDDADLQAVLARNLFPALRVSRAALPHLRGRGGGVIVMIASIYGRESGGGPSYNVAKAAEISLAKAMARDLAKDRIRVVSVAPGSILFPGGGWERRQQADPAGIAAFVEREIPFGRFGRPEEIGDVVAFLCSPRAGWITGACVPVDGGQGRAF
jgi:3-oxoacyl-[acyl-carrier protein] reductase